MACTCYDRPIVYFNAAASQLQVSLDRGTSPSLEILGGAIPPNKLGVVVSPMKIPLTAQSDGSLSGGANFFSAAVTGSQIRVVVNDQTGYRSESYLKYSSDDCGFGGNRLYCTFQSP